MEEEELGSERGLELPEWESDNPLELIVELTDGISPAFVVVDRVAVVMSVKEALARICGSEVIGLILVVLLDSSWLKACWKQKGILLFKYSCRNGNLAFPWKPCITQLLFIHSWEVKTKWNLGNLVFSFQARRGLNSLSYAKIYSDMLSGVWSLNISPTNSYTPDSIPVQAN